VATPIKPKMDWASLSKADPFAQKCRLNLCFRL